MTEQGVGIGDVTRINLRESRHIIVIPDAAIRIGIGQTHYRIHAVLVVGEPEFLPKIVESALVVVFHPVGVA